MSTSSSIPKPSANDDSAYVLCRIFYQDYQNPLFKDGKYSHRDEMFILWRETNPLSAEPLRLCGIRGSEAGFESV